MNGEKAYADSKGIRRRGGHLLSDNHPLAEGTAAARGGTEIAGCSDNDSWQAQSLADPGVTGCEGPETGSQTETRLEEGAEAQDGGRGTDDERGRQIDLLTLPYVMLSELRYLPTCGGIYFAIEEGGEVAYIGRSLNIRLRWRAHPVAADLCEASDLATARHVRLAWLAVEEAQQLDQLEREFIRQFRPRLNQIHNGEPKPIKAHKPRRAYTAMPHKPGGKRKQRMFTAVKFAGEMSISYPTMVRWLKRGLVPGATLEETPAGNYWQIPESALQMERPKAGRPPKLTDGEDEQEMQAAAVGDEVADEPTPAKPKRGATKRSPAKKAMKKSVKKRGTAK